MRAHVVATVLFLALHVVAPGGGATWLGNMMLSAENLPGYLPLSSAAMPVTDIIEGQGAFYDQLRAGSVMAGYQRSYVRFGGDTELRIQLVEFVNSYFAGSAPRPEGEIPATGFAGRGAMVGQGIASGQLNTIVVFHRGRVQVQMRLVSDRAPTSRKAAAALLARFANEQYAKMPAAPDLTKATSVPVRGPQLQLYFATLSAILLLQLAIWLCVSLVDRTVRDAVLRWLGGRPDQLDARVVVFDMQPLVRQRRRRYRWGVVARMAAVLGLYTLAYFNEHSSVTSIGLLAGCGFVFAVAQAIVNRWTNRGNRFWSAGSVILWVAGSMLSLTLAGAAAQLLFLRAFLAVSEPGDLTAQQVSAFSTLTLSLALILFLLADLPSRLMQRISARSAKSVLRKDDRPEILLLRAFVDDQVRLRAHRTSRQPLLQRLTLRRRESFEEILAWSMWRFGPPVTLGEPGTRLPRLGAVRSYYADHEWRAAITSLIARSGVVVLVVGRSPSLVDEIRIIREGGWLAKCVFFLPPVANDELRTRMAVLTSALGIDPACVPRQDTSHPAVLAMSFDNSGALELSVARARDDITYQTAVELLCTAKLAGDVARVSDPEPLVRKLGVDVASLLRTSPTRAAVREARLRRVYAMATVLSFAGSALFSVFLTASGSKPAVVPMPGQVIARQQMYSMIVTSTGRFVGLDGPGSLVQEVEGNSVRPVIRLPAMHAVELHAGTGMVYATAATAPYRLVAVATEPDFHVAWIQQLAGTAGGVVEDAGHVFVALPNQGEVAVFDRSTGRPDRPIPVDHGPFELALANGSVVVSQTNGDSLDLIDPTRLVVTRRVPVGFSPARLAVVGGTLLVTSIEGEEAVEYSLATWRPGRAIRLPKFGGIFAVGDGTIIVGTYDTPARLEYVDLRTLRMTKSVATPSQAYSIVFQDSRFYCDYPDSGVISSVTR